MNAILEHLAEDIAVRFAMTASPPDDLVQQFDAATLEQSPSARPVHSGSTSFSECESHTMDLRDQDAIDILIGEKVDAALVIRALGQAATGEVSRKEPHHENPERVLYLRCDVGASALPSEDQYLSRAAGGSPKLQRPAKLTAGNDPKAMRLVLRLSLNRNSQYWIRGLNAKDKTRNSAVRDVALRGAWTNAADLRGRQSYRRPGQNLCCPGGHPVDTLLCNDPHPNAVGCNFRHVFVASFDSSANAD